jgi:hypothetical protein
MARRSNRRKGKARPPGVDGPPGAAELVRRYGRQLAAAGAAMLLVLAAALYATSSTTPAAPATPRPVAVDEPPLPYYYHADDFANIMANPAHTNCRHFLQTTVEFGLRAYEDRGDKPDRELTGKLGDQEKLLALLGESTGRMRAIIIDVLRSRTLAQLNPEGLETASGEIRRILNERVLGPLFAARGDGKRVVVDEVLFTRFILQ